MLPVNKIEVIKQWLVEVLQSRTQDYSKKDMISVFLVLQGSAEALIRWGGKIYHPPIARFQQNISAKNY